MITIQELKNDLGDDWEDIVIRLCEGGNTWQIANDYDLPISTVRHALKDREALLMIVLRRYRVHLRLIKKVA